MKSEPFFRLWIQKIDEKRQKTREKSAKGKQQRQTTRVLEQHKKKEEKIKNKEKFVTIFNKLRSNSSNNNYNNKVDDAGENISKQF